MNHLFARRREEIWQEITLSSNTPIISTECLGVSNMAQDVLYTNAKKITKRKGKIIMKKLAMAFVTVLIVAGMASSALADPGWSHGPRFNNHGRYNQPQHHYQNFHHNHWAHHHQPMVMHRAPVIPPRPVVRAYQPQAASFSMFLPGFSIQIR